MKFFPLIGALFLILNCCSEQKDSVPRDIVKLNDTVYPMEAMLVFPIRYDTYSYWLVFVTDDEDKPVNEMYFAIRTSSVTDNMPVGKFIFKPGDLEAVVNLGIRELGPSISYIRLSEGTLELKKQGDKYTVSFDGVIDGLHVSCRYSGRAVFHPEQQAP